MRFSLLALGAVASVASASDAMPSWSPAAYSDEEGFKARIGDMVERIAEGDFLSRSMARSTCPDTGQAVYSWALEGEPVLSPFTGRKYIQGPTGYFGPKRRDAEGRISHFGGDPLKTTLPSAAAALIVAKAKGADADSGIKQRADKARAYLSIPGNLRQQYHFACVNWARFIPLAGDAMPEGWLDGFREAVATYEENRRPSDGAIREYQPLPRTETLVGLVDEHLGGGGTENHKTMWRSSGLLYAQWFPEGSKISGFPREEAREAISTVLTRYIRGLHTLGGGEYDSTTYYPYSLRAFLNLYDFSPDPSTKAWAQAALDYYLATYALKVHNGIFAGAQRRGWVDGDRLGEMDSHLHAWVPTTTAPVDTSTWITTLHQATTTYRPNRLIERLISKELTLPFEAEIAHPSYGMDARNAHPEYVYASRSFAMSSVQVDLVNNSGQQTTWALHARGPSGSLVFGGGQPRWLHPEGHSPYDQWVQKRGALVLMTHAAEGPLPPSRIESFKPEHLEGARGYTRQHARSGPLAEPQPPPTEASAFESWFQSNRSAAASWLFVPRDLSAKVTVDGSRRLLVETPSAWIRITPFNDRWYWIDVPADPAKDVAPKGARALLSRYRLLVVPGLPAGFAIDAVERSDYPDRLSLPETSLSIKGNVAVYKSLAGDTLELEYQSEALRPRARINGQLEDWSDWADGGVYDSPYLKVRDGQMWISDGREAYEVDCRGEVPVWRAANPLTSQP